MLSNVAVNWFCHGCCSKQQLVVYLRWYYFSRIPFASRYWKNIWKNSSAATGINVSYLNFVVYRICSSHKSFNWYITAFIAISILFLNILCLLFVLKYYQELKMLKRITQEVIIPIPYRVVSFIWKNDFYIHVTIVSIYSLSLIYFLGFIFQGSVSFSKGEHACGQWKIQASLIWFKSKLCHLNINFKCSALYVISTILDCSTYICLNKIF